MRKRSGLLFLVIGAALLLFSMIFLFWPTNADRPIRTLEVASPAERVAPALARDEASAAKSTESPAPAKEDKIEIIAGDRGSNKSGRASATARDGDGTGPKGAFADLEPSEAVDASEPRRRSRPKPRPKSERQQKPKLPTIDGAVTEKLVERGPANETRHGKKRVSKKAGKREFAQKPRTLGESEPEASPPRKTKSLNDRSKALEEALNLDVFDVFGNDTDRREANRDKDTPVKPAENVGVLDVGDDRPVKPPDDPAARTKMTETSVDPKSTFAIDVDTGSYTLARARMREGYPPKKNEVRIEEFVNYFHYDYPEPVEGEFAVALEAAPDPLSTNPRRHLVRIGVQGRSVPTDERPPAHLTFLVDVSGSMFGPDQLGLVIESLDLVTRNLQPEDTIAVVTFSTDAEVKMWPAGATERDIISRTIATLEPGGSSALDKGLDLAYEVASTHFVAGEINRVVLLGDGRVNAGETDPGKLLRAVRYGVEDGVELSTIGFGAKSFNDRMMEQLADRGNGAYYFVDSFREAQKVFGDYLCGTLFTIAKDVKIQVEFNPKSVVRHRLLGYENRELEHHQFRDDSVDAGEIGAGHSVTAIYEVDLTEELDETIGSVSVRYKKPTESKASELNFQLFSEELIADVRQASADFKFAAAVAMYAEIARGTMPSDEARISLVREIAGEGTPKPDEQPDRAEFLALVDETAMFFVN